MNKSLSLLRAALVLSCAAASACGGGAEDSPASRPAALSERNTNASATMAAPSPTPVPVSPAAPAAVAPAPRSPQGSSPPLYIPPTDRQGTGKINSNRPGGAPKINSNRPGGAPNN